MFLKIRPSPGSRRPQVKNSFLSLATWTGGNGRSSGRSLATKGQGVKYWNAERLRADPKYPLSEELSNYIHPFREKGAARNKQVYIRSQSVSPGLCGTLSLRDFRLEFDCN